MPHLQSRFCARCRVEDLARDRAYCSAACRDTANAIAPGAGRLARGLHETAAGAEGTERLRACGAFWNPTDYRTDVATIYCSRCKEPLQRPAPAATSG